MIGMQVELDLKGRGNSSAKKTPAGRGKGGFGSLEKRGARVSGTGTKRKRWDMVKCLNSVHGTLAIVDMAST